MPKFLDTARTVRVPTAENVVRNGLKARKTGLVAFDLLPHLAVQFSTQITFRIETILDCSGVTCVRVFFEDSLVRFRIRST